MKCSNIRVIGVPEGEEVEQKIENLFEQIMKENFPNLAKEIYTSRKSRKLRVPKKLDLRRNTPRHVIIPLAKMKQKERILEAAREKDTVTYKGPVSYTHLTLPTTGSLCRSRWSPYH